MLESQIIANLLQQACIRLDFVGHGDCVHLNIVEIALAQRQRYSDDNYSKGDKLDERIGLLSRVISMTEETRGATAQRVGRYHGLHHSFH